MQITLQQIPRPLRRFIYIIGVGYLSARLAYLLGLETGQPTSQREQRRRRWTIKKGPFGAA